MPDTRTSHKPTLDIQHDRAELIKDLIFEFLNEAGAEIALDLIDRMSLHYFSSNEFAGTRKTDKIDDLFVQCRLRKLMTRFFVIGGDSNFLIS